MTNELAAAVGWFDRPDNDGPDAGLYAEAAAAPVEDEDGPRACFTCGETETVELCREEPDGCEQCITLCAGCGSDES